MNTIKMHAIVSLKSEADCIERFTNLLEESKSIKGLRHSKEMLRDVGSCTYYLSMKVTAPCIYVPVITIDEAISNLAHMVGFFQETHDPFSNDNQDIIDHFGSALIHLVKFKSTYKPIVN